MRKFSVIAAASLALAALTPAAYAQVMAQSEADFLLQEQVKEALKSDKRLESSIFTVTALDGRVSISGTVKTDAQVAQVYRDARRIAGKPVTAFIDVQAG